MYTQRFLPSDGLYSLSVCLCHAVSGDRLSVGVRTGVRTGTESHFVPTT